MVGIGVGIDYALLIVTRFRSASPRARTRSSATLTSIATAGRAVLFAGMTVVISMLGILLMGQPAMTGFAFTVVLAVLVVMVASVTLLPAMLGFAGRNIERLHVPFVSRSVRVVRHVTVVPLEPLRPAPALVGRGIGGLAVLLALAAPFLGIRFGFPDAKNDPPDLTTRQAYDLLADGFGPGFSAPMLLTVQGESGGDAARRGRRGRHGSSSRSAAWRSSAPHSSTPRATPPCSRWSATTSPQDSATEDLVDSCSATRPSRRPSRAPGSPSTSAGSVPANVDTTRGVASRLPLFFGGVLLMSFLLLMMVFRSVLVPLKAVIMNLLASAAAFGVLALAVSGGRWETWSGSRRPSRCRSSCPSGSSRSCSGSRWTTRCSSCRGSRRSTTGPATTRWPLRTGLPSRRG